MDVHFCYSTTAVVALLPLLLTVQLFLFSPASCSSDSSYYCDWCPRHSTASLFPPDAAADLINGACGYGATAMELDGGYYVAAASAHFFHDGQGCGACYQLRCRDRRACGEDGVEVVVTDVVKEAATNRTAGPHFLLTKEAFTVMSAVDQFTSLDMAEVDFRREWIDTNVSTYVQGAVRVQEQEPGSTSGRDEQQGPRSPRHQFPLSRWPDRHRRRRNLSGGWQCHAAVAVHDAPQGRPRGVAHVPRPRRPAAAPPRRHGRLRRQVAADRQGGAARGLAARRGVRHRYAGNRRRRAHLQRLLRHRGRRGRGAQMTRTYACSNKKSSSS